MIVPAFAAFVVGNVVLRRYSAFPPTCRQWAWAFVVSGFLLAGILVAIRPHADAGTPSPRSLPRRSSRRKQASQSRTPPPLQVAGSRSQTSHRPTGAATRSIEAVSIAPGSGADARCSCRAAAERHRRQR